MQKTMSAEQQRRSERLAHRRSISPKNTSEHFDELNADELDSPLDAYPRSPPTPPLLEERETIIIDQDALDRTIVFNSAFAACGILAALLWVGFAPFRAHTIVLSKSVHVTPDFVLAALCASWSAGLLYAMHEVRSKKA